MTDESAELSAEHAPARNDAGDYRCRSCGTAWPCEPYRTQPARRGGEKRRGTHNGRAKLTPAQVTAIRELSGDLSMRAIARILELDPTTVSDAINRTNWKSV